MNSIRCYECKWNGKHEIEEFICKKCSRNPNNVFMDKYEKEEKRMFTEKEIKDIVKKEVESALGINKPSSKISGQEMTCTGTGYVGNFRMGCHTGCGC